MKIKLDENLPLQTATMLAALGHDVQTVREEGLTGSTDRAVWEMAQREERFLITQDLDFSDRRRFAPGTHHGILLIRLRSPSRHALIERVGGLFRTEDTVGWGGCFVVATERKVRVRRAQQK
ncbi:MAG: DUF5615 family PIN-like protein [Acidobacteriia bacterium]|nr:DUF5615 family PIN-like protein [Terriglobia bacterium]